MKILIASLIACVSVNAHASGCIRGTPSATATTILPPEKILLRAYYGDPDVKLQVWGAIWAVIDNVGTENRRLTFKSDVFDYKKIDVGDLLDTLSHLPDSIMATVEQDTVTDSDDGCGDPPAISTVLTYIIVLKSSSGTNWRFRAVAQP